MSNTKMQEPSVAAWKVIAIWDTKFFLTHAHVRLCFRISPLLLWRLMIYRMEHFGFPAVWVWVSGVRPEQFRFVFVKIIQHRTLKVLNVWPTPICLYGIQNLYPQSKVRRVMSKKRNICEFVPTECWVKLTTKYFNYNQLYRYCSELFDTPSTPNPPQEHRVHFATRLPGLRDHENGVSSATLKRS